MSQRVATTVRRVAGVLAALMAGATIAVVTPTAAFAASPGCGSACNARNPSTYLATVGTSRVYCANDAITLDDNYLAAYGMTVQLRYSPKCRTVWARVYGGAAPSSREYNFGIAGHLSSYYYSTYGLLQGGGRNYSNMWDDKNVVNKACFHDGSVMAAVVCTNYY